MASIYLLVLLAMPPNTAREPRQPLQGLPGLFVASESTSQQHPVAGDDQPLHAALIGDETKKAQLMGINITTWGPQAASFMKARLFDAGLVCLVEHRQPPEKVGKIRKD